MCGHLKRDLTLNGDKFHQITYKSWEENDRLQNPHENLMNFFQFFFWTFMTFLKKKKRNMQQNILLKFVCFEFVRNFAPKNLIYK